MEKAKTSSLRAPGQCIRCMPGSLATSPSFRPSSSRPSSFALRAVDRRPPAVDRRLRSCAASYRNEDKLSPRRRTRPLRTLHPSALRTWSLVLGPQPAALRPSPSALRPPSVVRCPLSVVLRPLSEAALPTASGRPAEGPPVRPTCLRPGPRRHRQHRLRRAGERSAPTRTRALAHRANRMPWPGGVAYSGGDSMHAHAWPHALGRPALVLVY